ncbi:MAG: DNA-3-methyladenine glycosylase I [Proteobacteria bacterium]|nr:DNA-3-methyladenine glycosylase I [Pseudomonadota bacterium]MBU4470601.1 DNA-3-methyladenine glycosylase I [Pseudomonadota bacterium]
MESCEWPAKDPLMIEYHDKEWGVPVHDDQKHFEFLLLDGFQAGLSWATILKKREGFRKAFDHFDIDKVAKYNEKKVEQLLLNKDIIRNNLKIRAAIHNASKVQEIQKEFGSFDKYIWQFTGNKTMINQWKSLKEIPSTSPESDAMSKDLKKRGFKFVGSTICYAYMQAAGMVNDHLVTCFRHQELT